MKITDNQIMDKISWFGNKVFGCYYIVDNSERMTFRYDKIIPCDVNFDMSGLAFYVSVQNRKITIGYNSDMPICFISEHEKGGVVITPNESIKDISTYYYLLLLFVLSSMDNVWDSIYADNVVLKSNFGK